MWLAAAALAAPPALLTLGAPTNPEGVRADWSMSGCNLQVRIHNQGAAPVEVDWVRSVWAAQGEAAVPLLPGSASRQAGATAAIPPLVIPPGSYGDEVIYRRDRTSPSSSCLYSVPSAATVTLATSAGWLVQPVTIEVDQGRVDAAESQAAFLDAKSDLASAIRRRNGLRGWGLGIGIGGLAIGSLMLVNGLGEGTDEGVTQGITGAVVVGGGGAALGTWMVVRSRHWEEERVRLQELVDQLDAARSAAAAPAPAPAEPVHHAAPE